MVSPHNQAKDKWRRRARTRTGSPGKMKRELRLIPDGRARLHPTRLRLATLRRFPLRRLLLRRVQRKGSIIRRCVRKKPRQKARPQAPSPPSLWSPIARTPLPPIPPSPPSTIARTPSPPAEPRNHYAELSYSLQLETQRMALLRIARLADQLARKVGVALKIPVAYPTFRAAAMALDEQWQRSTEQVRQLRGAINRTESQEVDDAAEEGRVHRSGSGGVPSSSLPLLRSSRPAPSNPKPSCNMHLRVAVLNSGVHALRERAVGDLADTLQMANSGVAGVANGSMFWDLLARTHEQASRAQAALSGGVIPSFEEP